MDLNDGRFSVNGRCGYVLKPAFLRSNQSAFDPEAPRRGAGQRPVALTIKVLWNAKCVCAEGHVHFSAFENMYQDAHVCTEDVGRFLRYHKPMQYGQGVRPSLVIPVTVSKICICF